MADANFGSERNEIFKEAVCIDAGRVFDSCCDRDCLEELRVYFTAEGQEQINNAVSIKIKSAQIVYTTVDVETVNLSRGFYSCDLTFFFLVGIDVYNAPHSCPTEIKGIALFNKKVVLYGGEGNVKTFTSDMNSDTCITVCDANAASSPKCVVQTVDPIPLSSRPGPNSGQYDNIGMIPTCVLDFLGGSIVTEGDPVVYVTIGIFTIVQLVRNVQVLVPVYDYCIPEKQCDCATDQPCEVFRKIQFPTEDFFPNSNGNCACN